MFISNFVQSKIVSRLRPWLLEEPEAVLELGLLASHGCAKNLMFDPSALNTLIEDSTLLEFKRVVVGELIVRVRPWSRPSIVVEVRGFHATLAHRATSTVQFVNRDSAARRKKEMIVSLDSEGAFLHDAIERLLARDILGNQGMTSWADVIASCSQIKFQDCLLELKLPEKSHACLLEIYEFAFESQCLHSTSLFRKFFDSFFVHGRSELSISCSNMKFGVKENEQIKWITSLMGLSVNFKLIGFHFLSNFIHARSIAIELSPEVIPLLLLIVDTFSPKEHVRTGKELWRLAADRIGHLTLGIRSLQNLGEMVVLWLRYVYTYSFLLTAVGCLSEVSLKENVGKPFVDRKSIIQAKHQLGVIFHLEEKLPAQMVVQARRIARNKRFHVSTDLKKPMGVFSTLLRKILAVFWFLWKVICFIFQEVLLFSLWNVLNLNCSIDKSTTVGSQSVCLSFEEIFFTLAHSTNVHFPITKEARREDKLNLSSFYLTLRQLCLISKTDETKVSFFAALQEIKLCLAASLHVPLDHDLTIKRKHSSKEVYLKGIDESKIIFWGEPASLYTPPQVVCNDDSLKPFGILLENDIGGLWSSWNKIRGKLEVNASSKGDAFLLFELKHFLADPYVKNGACGLRKYSLNIGKMNLELDYSCILSAVLLFRQLEDHSQWTTRSRITPAMLPTSSIVVDKSEISMKNVVGFYANKVVSAILNVIPGENIHMGAVIAGLGIGVSLDERVLSYIENDTIPVLSQRNGCHWFKIDIGTTEFVIWPASASVLSAMTGETIFEEITSEYLWLKEPQISDAYQEEYVDDKFISSGCMALNVCLRSKLINVSSGFELNNHSHIIEPILITFKASICRNYQHTFYATTDIVSVAASLLSSSVGVLFYMDELRNLFLLFEGLLLEVAASYNNIASDGLRRTPELVRRSRDNFYLEAVGCGMNLHNRVLRFSGTFEVESTDIVLGGSRRVQNTKTSNYGDLTSLSASLNKKEKPTLDVFNLLGFGLAFTVQNSCIKFSLEEDTCDVLIDLSGLQTVLLDLHYLIIISNGLSQMKEILSLKWNYQFHLAHCRLKLHVKFLYGVIGCSDPNNVIHSLDSPSHQTSYEIEESRCRHEMPSSIDEEDLMYEFGTLHATLEPASGCSFVVVAELGDIVVSEYHDTVLFKREDQQSKFKMLISSGEDLYKIVCKIKGGCIFLEALALTKFLYCFQVYSVLIASFPLRVVHASREPSIAPVFGSGFVSPASTSSNQQVLDFALSTSSSEARNTIRWSVDALTIHLNHFSLILAVTGFSGEAKELVVDVDVLLRILGFGRKIVVDLHGLTVSTQRPSNTMLNEKGDRQIQHFCSKTSIDSATRTPAEKYIPDGFDYVSSGPSMRHLSFDMEENNVTAHSFYHKHFILKHLVGSATVEKVDLEGDRFIVEFNSNWAGKGSISGLNVMLKLSEMKVLLKNLPPNSSVINEIMENVKSFLVSKALLKGDPSASSRPLRHLRSENDWKLGPTVLTLCEHLFVSFAIRVLRNGANKFISGIEFKGKEKAKAITESECEISQDGKEQRPASRTWSVGKFFFSAMIAYLDGRLCRHIPNPLARRIVSGFLLSFLDRNDGQ